MGFGHVHGGVCGVLWTVVACELDRLCRCHKLQVFWLRADISGPGSEGRRPAVRELQLTLCFAGSTYSSCCLLNLTDRGRKTELWAATAEDDWFGSALAVPQDGDGSDRSMHRPTDRPLTFIKKLRAAAAGLDFHEDKEFADGTEPPCNINERWEGKKEYYNENK